MADALILAFGAGALGLGAWGILAGGWYILEADRALYRARLARARWAWKTGKGLIGALKEMDRQPGESLKPSEK